MTLEFHVMALTIPARACFCCDAL